MVLLSVFEESLGLILLSFDLRDQVEFMHALNSGAADLREAYFDPIGLFRLGLSSDGLCFKYFLIKVSRLGILFDKHLYSDLLVS